MMPHIDASASSEGKQNIEVIKGKITNWKTNVIKWNPILLVLLVHMKK